MRGSKKWYAWIKFPLKGCLLKYVEEYSVLAHGERVEAAAAACLLASNWVETLLAASIATLASEKKGACYLHPAFCYVHTLFC